MRRRAVRAIARGPRSRRARARRVAKPSAGKGPAARTDGATALNLPAARGASRATFGAYAPKDHHVSLDEFSLDDDGAANDVRGAVGSLGPSLAPAPTGVSDRAGSPPPLTSARRGELRDRDIPDFRIESPPGGPSSSRAPVPATRLRETSAARQPRHVPRPPRRTLRSNASTLPRRAPPRRASSRPRVRETPRRGPARGEAPEDQVQTKTRDGFGKDRVEGEGGGGGRGMGVGPASAIVSSLALADPRRLRDAATSRWFPARRFSANPIPRRPARATATVPPTPSTTGGYWTVAGEAMLVHARSLRDRAETLPSRRRARGHRRADVRERAHVFVRAVRAVGRP